MNARVKYAGVVFAGSDKVPTKEFVRGVNAATAEGRPTLDMALGVASLNYEGMYRVEHHGHRVIWALGGANSLKKQLPVCAHVKGPDTAGSMQRSLGFIGTAGARQYSAAFHGR